MTRRAGKGFTLIEMAFVMVILGLVFSGAIRIVKPFLDSNKGEITQRHLDIVQKALQVYVIRYGCLPCPASGTANGGVAGQNPGVALNTGGTYVTSAVHCTSVACATANNVVPWITLGISEEEASDGWSDRIRYAVAGNNTSGASCASSGTSVTDTSGMVRSSVSCFPVGTLTVDDLRTGAAADRTDVVYVLVSSGPDRAFAFRQSTGTYTGNLYSQSSGGQFENSTDSDGVFAEGDYSGSGTSRFDDIVRAISAPVMVQLCGPNACGNPA